MRVLDGGWYALACGLAFSLAGCGGGGGEGDIVITSVYTDETAFLFHPSSIDVRVTGTNVGGADLRCELVAGELPPGMQVRSGSCSVEGTPTAAGRFTATIRIKAQGASGSVTEPLVFDSIGPAMTYVPVGTRLYAGVPVSLTPFDLALTFGDPTWQPLAGETVTYSVVSGSLPSGLSLDAATGRISGLPREVGVSAFTVRTVTNSGGRVDTRTATEQQIVISQGLLAFYGPNNTPVYIYQDQAAELSLLVSNSTDRDIADFAFSNFRPADGQSLPVGVNLNAVSGQLNAAGLAPAIYEIRIAADLAIDGQTYYYEFEPLELNVASR